MKGKTGYSGRLYAKYWGYHNLEKNDTFWDDVCEYYHYDLGDAPLPLEYTPRSVRRVLEMLECPSGGCGWCCRYYRKIQITQVDINRITENTGYTLDDIDKINDPNGCIFLKDNNCSIYKFRPDVCYLFPTQTKNGKQLSIRLQCKPAVVAARKLITESLSEGGKLLLPDLQIIERI